MDMRFGTWSVGQVKGIAKGMKNINKLWVRFIGITDIRCVLEPAEDYAIFQLKGHGSHQFCPGLFVHERIISPGLKVEFISHRMSYTLPLSSQCDTALNVYD